MCERERIMLECRYLLSLNKNYNELASLFKLSVKDIYHDLNIKLPNIDTNLYNRVNKVLKEKNCS